MITAGAACCFCLHASLFPFAWHCCGLHWSCCYRVFSFSLLYSQCQNRSIFCFLPRRILPSGDVPVQPRQGWLGVIEYSECMRAFELACFLFVATDLRRKVTRRALLLHQVELKPWVEENFATFASAMGNSPLSRYARRLLLQRLRANAARVELRGAALSSIASSTKRRLYSEERLPTKQGVGWCVQRSCPSAPSFASYADYRSSWFLFLSETLIRFCSAILSSGSIPMKRPSAIPAMPLFLIVSVSWRQS